eukprot:GHVN01046175.1.p2 GENE.GHVN01046175.1~~GHVN01046175.1.p2  ORF type:complete len:102 (+),score=1.15 GHVN01046175.1:699-1004(+)
MVLHAEVLRQLSVAPPTTQDLAKEARVEGVEEESKVTWEEGVPRYIRTGALYIPRKYRSYFLFWFHASRYGGHHGIRRTLKRMSRLISGVLVNQDPSSLSH